MWWGDCPPSNCSTRYIRSETFSLRLHHYPNWRQYRYFPLSIGDEYASGITFYRNVTKGFSTCGIVINHRSCSFALGNVGYDEAQFCESQDYLRTAVHVPLGRGEYITAVWELKVQDIDNPDGSLTRGMHAVRSNIALDKD